VNSNLAEVNRMFLKLSEQITELREEMNRRINSIEIRLTAVETTLSIRLERQTDLRQRFLDFSFKLAWVALFAVLTTSFTVISRIIH